MFEGLSDWDLIDVMGESTRYESTATAQRLLCVAELFERRSGALAELAWCCADGCDAVAAEVSAAQNISHARAVGQVQFACALKYRLPAVAKVFLRGTIDYRVVSMIISRTENVDDEVMAGLDEAIAARVEKWMKLSTNKLRDRIDQWVAKYDAAGVRVPPEVDDNRYVDVEAASPGMANLSGAFEPPTPQPWTPGWRRWRPPCAPTIPAPTPNAALMRAGRWAAWKPPWPANVGGQTARPARPATTRRRRPAW